MKENIIENKTFDFAVKIVNLYKYLTNDKKEYFVIKSIPKIKNHSINIIF